MSNDPNFNQTGSPAERARPAHDFGAPPGAGLARIAGQLHLLRRQARVLLLVQRLTLLLAALLLVALVAGLVDYAVRWPRELRVAVWLLTVAAVGWAVWRAGAAAWHFRPALVEVALRLERSHPNLVGWLASALELSDAAAPSPLAQPTVHEATQRMRGVRATALLNRRPAYQTIAGLTAIALVLMLMASLSPMLMSIGARRVLTPWVKLDWPKRTGVIDVTGVGVHPIGTALALRAGLVKTDRPADSSRVEAFYRLLRIDADGAASTVVGSGMQRGIDTQRVLLTSQSRPVDVENANSGTLFERLIEPTGLLHAGSDGRAGHDQVVLEYWFATADDQTEPARVLLVEPPAVIGATLRVTEPAYARRLSADTVASGPSGTEPVPPDPISTTADLGPGNDDRSAPPGMLAGSRVSVTIRLNKPMPRPPGSGSPSAIDRAPRAAWIRTMLGTDLGTIFEPPAPACSSDAASPAVATSGDPELTTDAAGQEWTVSWRLDTTTRLEVRAVDEHGLRTTEETRYTLEAIRDGVPTAAITAPPEDRSVLSTATIEVQGEGRDDVGLEYVAVERQRARRPGGSAGAPVEPDQDRTEIGRSLAAPRADPASENSTTASPAANLRVVHTTTLDLSELDLKPGDELWLTALAADGYDLDGVRHDPVRSSARKLRIISRQDLVEQVWAELAGVRRSAIAIDQDQERAADSLEQRSQESREQSARAQAGITDRLARQQESISRVERELEQNQLSEEPLDRVLDEARRLLRDATATSGRAAAAASESSRQAATDDPKPNQPKPDQPTPDQPKQADAATNDAQEAQQQVRDQLADLIELLDQGQDTWASKRAIERLLQEQKSLAERTAQAGQRTAGKSGEQLSPAERKELNELAAEQQAGAERTREAVEKMLERAEQMRQADPAASQGLEDAAKRAQREAVSERQQEAARQVEQNQTNNAQQQQARAAQSLQQMLGDMDQSARNRDAVLRRQLASLIESIEALIAQQREQLAALDAAETTAQNNPEAAFNGLDAAMVRLHQKTLGVLDEAASGPRETVGLARFIDRAARAQQAAAVALRDRPVNAEEARDQEQTSLEQLEEALLQAEQTDDQAESREEARARDELKAKYAGTLERQTSLNEATLPLVGAEQNRRTRNSARLIGQDQSTLRDDLAKIKAQTADLSDAKVFEFAHKRLDDLMARAATTLTDGRADTEVARRQASAARVLKSMIDALDGRRKKDRPFREMEEEQAGGGQGQGGQQKGLPPEAELKLLRALQEEAIALTREVNDLAARGTPDPAAATEATSMQREIAEQGRLLLERVTQRDRGPAGPAEPAPPGDGENGEPPTDLPPPPDGDTP